VVFAKRYGMTTDRARYKNCWVLETVGISTGFLIAAVHRAGLVCLEYIRQPDEVSDRAGAAAPTAKIR